jgi:serine/threonine protein kinase
MIRFEKFKVIKKLGEGGMSNVFLIDYENKRYALKELKQTFLQDSDKLQRFKNEANIIKSFDCPNIIKIITPAKFIRVYKDDEYIYKSLVYIMEYIEASSLKDILEQQPLSIKQVNDLFTAILTALDYSHTKGVIHRDIKPGNILIKNINDLKSSVLCDFGIAKMSRKITKTEEELTQELSVLGAPAYMSPEQINDSRNVSPRSDLYSVGVVMYEVLTGIKPYIGNKWDIIYQHKNEKIKPKPPRQINHAIDEKLERLTLLLLEKNPRNRPSSAKEASNMLFDATTSVTSSPQIDWKSLFYTKNIIINIEYISKKMSFNKSYTNFPISIGRLDINKKDPADKFSLPEYLRTVSRDHSDIFINEKNELIYRDKSRYGTNVNNISIKNDSVPLKLGKNVLTLANTARINVYLNERKIVSKAFVFSTIGALALTTIIIITFSLV